MKRARCDCSGQTIGFCTCVPGWCVVAIDIAAKSAHRSPRPVVPRNAGAGETGIGMVDQAAVVVTLVMGDFAVDPRRQGNRLALVRQLHLGDDKPRVLAVEKLTANRQTQED